MRSFKRELGKFLTSIFLKHSEYMYINILIHIHSHAQCIYIYIYIYVYVLILLWNYLSIFTWEAEEIYLQTTSTCSTRWNLYQVFSNAFGTFLPLLTQWHLRFSPGNIAYNAYNLHNTDTFSYHPQRLVVEQREVWRTYWTCQCLFHYLLFDNPCDVWPATAE